MTTIPNPKNKEILRFIDGRCDIYSVKDNQLSEKLVTLCFGDRTIGYNRYYAANTAGTSIDRIIQIPTNHAHLVTAKSRVVIDHMIYTIDETQILNSTHPPATVLTLKKIGVIPNGG